MKLKILLYEMLQEASIEQLQQQFVDTKKITPADFKEITDATGSKGAYATWLCKKVADKMIKGEDVYKFKKYFGVFDKNKKQYPQADINLYKSKDDVTEFIKKSVDISDKHAADPSTQKGVSKTDKYKELKIGSVDGFDVYELPKGRTDLYSTSCELGSGTEWCTATGKTNDFFNGYIKKDSLFIFIKGIEKYQYHPESGSFMDKNDHNVDLSKVEMFSLYKWLCHHKNYELPVEVILTFQPEELKGKTVKEVDLGDSAISDDGHIIRLPENLTVTGDMNLNRSYIGKLPDNLTIGGDLSIWGTSIEYIPKNLKIGGDFYVRNTPLYKRSNEKVIRSNIENSGGYVKGEITGGD
jgi:hypothetical protein